MLHKSGLYKYEASTNIKNLDQAVLSIQKRGIDDKVYHKHSYNDANYLVLAKVIEKVTGKPYVQNYYERLGNKFHLEHSAFTMRSHYKMKWLKVINLRMIHFHSYVLMY